MSAFILMIALAGAAQTGADQIAPGGLLIDRTRVDRAPPPLPPAVPGGAIAPVRITGDATGATIKGIRFVGAKAPATVARAAHRFLGRHATKAVLGELATNLSTAYGDSPVALYTVAIPDQNFAGGVVIVSLTEGRIGHAQVRSNRSHANRLLRRRMAPLLAEAPLSRATFERQLTLMRAIPGLTITPDLTDPDGSGALTLTVTPKQRRTKFTAGYSNRGVSLLGDGQFDVRGDAYGLGLDGDQLTVAASTASDLRRFRYVSGGYAAPIGADGLTASGTVSYLETRPKGYPITGTAKQAGVTLSYPLGRSFTRSIDVSLGVDGLDSDNATFGNLIATERTRAVRMAASMAQAKTKRSLSLSVSLSHGIDALGARVTAPLADAGFAKATAGAAVAQAIGKRAVVRLSASGQYSDDALPAAERFAIGGETIGRAFDTSLLTGDRGVGGSAEVALRPLRSTALAQSEVYAFVDGGQVSILPRGAIGGQHYSLASAGAGIRARYRTKGELGLEGARVIDRPYATYEQTWRISVAWRLTI